MSLVRRSPSMGLGLICATGGLAGWEEKGLVDVGAGARSP